MHSWHIYCNVFNVRFYFRKGNIAVAGLVPPVQNNYLASESTADIAAYIFWDAATWVAVRCCLCRSKTVKYCAFRRGINTSLFLTSGSLERFFLSLKNLMLLAGQAGRLHAQCNYFKGFVAEILETNLDKAIGSKEQNTRFNATNEKCEHCSKQKSRREPGCCGCLGLFGQCCQHK